MSETTMPSARERSPSDYVTEASYAIHDNGGRPFVVNVSRDVVTVTARPGALGAAGRILSTDYYRGVFVGVDPVEGMHGNSVLVQEDDGRYLYIGSEVYRFETDDDTIVEYVSPIGHSDVPYPVAIGERNVYFMLDHEFVPRACLESPVTVDGSVDLYGEFYGHLADIAKPPRWPMRNVEVVWSHHDRARPRVETTPVRREWRRIGAGFRSVREQLGGTMGDLADVLGIAVGAVSDRELGRVEWTPAMLREHLAALLAISNR